MIEYQSFYDSTILKIDTLVFLIFALVARRVSRNKVAPTFETPDAKLTDDELFTLDDREVCENEAQKVHQKYINMFSSDTYRFLPSILKLLKHGYYQLEFIFNIENTGTEKHWCSMTSKSITKNSDFHAVKFFYDEKIHQKVDLGASIKTEMTVLDFGKSIVDIAASDCSLLFIQQMFSFYFFLDFLLDERKTVIDKIHHDHSKRNDYNDDAYEEFIMEDPDFWIKNIQWYCYAVIILKTFENNDDDDDDDDDDPQ